MPESIIDVLTNIREQTGSTARFIQGVNKQLESGLKADINLRVPRGLNRSLAAIERHTTTLHQNFLNLAKSGTDATIVLQKMALALNNLQKSSRVAQASLHQVGSSLGGGGTRNIHKNISQISDSLEALGARTRLAGQRFTAFLLAAHPILAIEKGIFDATNATVELNDQLTRLVQVVGGKSIRDIEGLQQTIFRLGIDLGVPIQQLGEMSLTLSQAGIVGRNLETVLQALAKASLTPTFENMTAATEGVVAIMGQFGIKADQIEEKLGKINVLSKDYAVESDDLIEAIQKAGGAFSTAGGSLEELLALMTATRSASRESASTIATAFRTIFQRIQRPGTIDFFGNLGIDLREGPERIFVGPFRAIQQISELFKKLPKGSPLTNLILEEVGGIRQLNKVATLFNTTQQQVEALNKIQKANNSINEDAQIRQQSLVIQLNKTKNAFIELFTTISQDRSILFLVTSVLRLTESLAKLTTQMTPIIPFIAALGIRPILGGVGRVAKGFANPIKAQSGGLVGGTGRGDRQPALLEAGEYVLPRRIVDRIGVTNLERMRRGQIQRFQQGGLFKGRFSASPVKVTIGGRNFQISSKKEAEDIFNSLVSPTTPTALRSVGFRLSGGRQQIASTADELIAAIAQNFKSKLDVGSVGEGGEFAASPLNIKLGQDTVQIRSVDQLIKLFNQAKTNGVLGFSFGAGKVRQASSSADLVQQAQQQFQRQQAAAISRENRQNRKELQARVTRELELQANFTSDIAKGNEENIKRLQTEAATRRIILKIQERSAQTDQNRLNLSEELVKQYKDFGLSGRFNNLQSNVRQAREGTVRDIRSVLTGVNLQQQRREEFQQQRIETRRRAARARLAGNLGAANAIRRARQVPFNQAGIPTNLLPTDIEEALFFQSAFTADERQRIFLQNAKNRAKQLRLGRPASLGPGRSPTSASRFRRAEEIERSATNTLIISEAVASQETKRRARKQLEAQRAAQKARTQNLLEEERILRANAPLRDARISEIRAKADARRRALSQQSQFVNLTQADIDRIPQRVSFFSGFFPPRNPPTPPGGSIPPVPSDGRRSLISRLGRQVFTGRNLAGAALLAGSTLPTLVEPSSETQAGILGGIQGGALGASAATLVGISNPVALGIAAATAALTVGHENVRQFNLQRNQRQFNRNESDFLAQLNNINARDLLISSIQGTGPGRVFIPNEGGLQLRNAAGRLFDDVNQKPIINQQGIFSGASRALDALSEGTDVILSLVDVFGALGTVFTEATKINNGIKSVGGVRLGGQSDAFIGGNIAFRLSGVNSARRFEEQEAEKLRKRNDELQPAAQALLDKLPQLFAQGLSAEQVKKGLGNEQVALLGTLFQNLSPDALTAGRIFLNTQGDIQAKNIQREIVESAKAARAGFQLISESTDFDLLGKALQRAAIAANEFAKSTDNAINLFSGQVGSLQAGGLVDRIQSVANTPNINTFNTLLKNATSQLGPVGAQFANSGIQLNQARIGLASALGTALGSGENDPIKISNIIDSRLRGIDPRLRSFVSDKIRGLDSEKVAELADTFQRIGAPATADELLKEPISAFDRQLNQIIGSLEAFNNSLDTEFKKITSLNSRLISTNTKTAQNINRDFEFRLRSRQITPDLLSDAAIGQQPFITQFQGLTKQAGLPNLLRGNIIDPNAPLILRQRFEAAQQAATKEETQIRVGGGNVGRLNQLQAEATAAAHALSLMSDNIDDFTRSLENSFNELERRRQSRLGTIENFLTGSPQDRFAIQKQLAGAQFLINQFNTPEGFVGNIDVRGVQGANNRDQNRIRRQLGLNRIEFNNLLPVLGQRVIPEGEALKDALAGLRGLGREDIITKVLEEGGRRIGLPALDPEDQEKANQLINQINLANAASIDATKEQANIIQGLIRQQENTIYTMQKNINNFTNSAKLLSESLEKFPTHIEMTGKHEVKVIINDGGLFAKLEPALKDFITTEINRAIGVQQPRNSDNVAQPQNPIPNRFERGNRR